LRVKKHVHYFRIIEVKRKWRKTIPYIHTDIPWSLLCSVKQLNDHMELVMSMEAFIRKLERRVSTIKETPQNGVLG
jgi:hypothetical protein